jgi:GT2 family glycosyltransferase
MHLVSILIPAYNAERWIADTIQCALHQTWPHKEIVVVDDGSTDGTLATARQFESSMVKVVSQQNSGACAARNHALALAHGDYIQWLDADDLLASDKIERQMSRALQDQNPRIMYTGSWGRFFFRPERARFDPDPLWRDLSPADWLVTKFEQGVWMNPTVWLVSRELTRAAGPWDVRCVSDDDGEYVSRLVAHSEGVNFVGSAKAYYRIGNVSAVTWNWRTAAKLDALALSTSLCINHLRQIEDSPRTRAACLRLLQSRLVHYYPSRPSLVEDANALARELGGALRPPATTRKFRLASSILGWRAATRLKNSLWRMETLLRKNAERLRSLGR